MDIQGKANVKEEIFPRLRHVQGRWESLTRLSKLSCFWLLRPVARFTEYGIFRGWIIFWQGKTQVHA